MKRTLYQRLFDSHAAIAVKKVEASRAIFESTEVQRVDVRLTDEAGNKLTLELRDRQVYDLIVQLTIAYQAMHPALPTNSAARWQGMD